MINIKTTLSGEVVEVKFYMDAYYNSTKYQLKNKLGKQSQPYMTMKAVNDVILKQIIHNYRDHNYSYYIEDDLNNIIFRLEL